MKKIIIFILIPLVVFGAAPKKYGNSKYWQSIQLKAANIYEADTNVPIVVGKTSMGNVIANSFLSTGLDIVITDANGNLIPREVTSFSKTDSTFQMYYRDPATHATNGGTTVYVQWGGNKVSVANDTTVWTSNYGGSMNHCLVVHGEETEANLTSEVSYTATDANITYAQNGVILKNPDYNGNNSVTNWGDITEINAVQKLTIMMWINKDAVDDNGAIFIKQKDASNTLDLFTDGSGTGTMYGFVDAIGNRFNYKYVDAGYSADDDMFLSFVYDGTLSGNTNRLKLYKNNAQVVSNLTYTGTIPSTSGNFAGAGFKIGATSGSFNGSIDELRIVVGALSLNKIKTQYDNQNGFSTNATLTIGPTRNFLDNIRDKKYLCWMKSFMSWSRRCLRY